MRPFELSDCNLNGIGDSASGGWNGDTEDLSFLIVCEDGVMALILGYLLAELGGHNKGPNCK